MWIRENLLLLRVCGSLFSGVLLALSFPGFGYSTLVFAALLPLMFAVHSASFRTTVWLTLLSGLVFFVISLWWLCNVAGKIENTWLAVSAIFGFGILAFYCALYFIPFGIAVSWGSKRWIGQNIWKNVCFMCSVTTLWVGSEYLRGTILTGFPWNLLGVSQYANPAMIQVAEWGGVAIVSACIVWMNASIFVTLRQYTHGSRRRKYRPHFELMIGILPIAFSVAYGMKELLNRPIPDESVNMVLVQPNIPQNEKWSELRAPRIREKLERLTHSAMRMEGLDIIIWPETTLPDCVRTSQESYELIKRITSGGVPLLAGSIDVSSQKGNQIFYNSSILFGKEATEMGKYDKQYLVPFGEYVPFSGLMRRFTPVKVDFKHGKESTIFLLNGKAPFSVLICFEDTMAPLAANAVRSGARWLVNQTNDGWFDPSAQSEQHLAHAVFRCVENRMPMARCCNTGVTAVIDAFGIIERKLKPMTSGFSSVILHPCPDGLKQTFYTRRGDVFAKASLISGSVLLLALFPKGRKK